MKSIYLILLISFFTWFVQTLSFDYSDSEFEINSTKIIYDFGWNPNGLGRLEKGVGERNMERLVQFLQDNKNLKVQIDSHRDSRGSEEFNRRVTDRRIEAFKFYFKNRVDLKRIKFKSYGESEPLIPISEIEKIKDEEERHRAYMRNDRIVITILGI